MTPSLPSKPASCAVPVATLPEPYCMPGCVTHHKWQGETCCMCSGTGRDRTAVTEPDHDCDRGCQRVVGYVENGRRCRACNGHGRDAS